MSNINIGNPLQNLLSSLQLTKIRFRINLHFALMRVEPVVKKTSTKNVTLNREDETKTLVSYGKYNED